MPQSPQLEVSVPRSVQLPAHAVLVPQSVAHRPLWQTSPVEQAVPHLPQLAWLEPRFTHLPLHAVYPGLQTRAHLPAWQNDEPLGTVGQIVPQLPQFWPSLSRRAQADPHAA